MTELSTAKSDTVKAHCCVGVLVIEVPLPTKPPPPASTALILFIIYSSENMHYIINISLIIPCHTAPYFRNVFSQSCHVSLVYCTS